MAKVVFEDLQQGVSEVAQGGAVLLDALQVLEQGLGREADLEEVNRGPRSVSVTSTSRDLTLTLRECHTGSVLGGVEVKTRLTSVCVYLCCFSMNTSQENTAPHTTGMPIRCSK